MKDKTRFAIVGAGLTGLSAAYHLRNQYVVFEKETSAGGLCRTVKKGGFYFDYSGHLLHIRSEHVKRLVDSLLPGKLVEHRRRAHIRYGNCVVNFPFQANVAALPADVKNECLLEFIYAYCDRKKKTIRTFEEWVHAHLGKGLARHFFVPYNTKLYGESLNNLTKEWCDQYVPKPSLQETVAGALGAQTRDFGYNVTFLYPIRGGIQILADALAQRVKNLRLGVAVAAVRWKQKELVSSAGETHGYESLVSTMPLPDLVNALDPSPRRVREAGRMLRWRTVHCVNIGVKKKDRTPSHWIYFPEPGYVFYRVGFIQNICRKSVPGGHSAYYVEIATDPNDRVDREALAKRSITDLARAGVLEPHDDVTAVQYLPMPYAYVVYDRARSSAVRLIFDFLEEHGIYSVGRYGGWKYSAMENAILDGKSVADKLKSK